ncbi:hypothetical protein NQ315_002605 [Exocentrus adspersus]|uniref:HTH CENPB-type domain-containing protein n=1 Tax=Exocentrus adspersus TaxID=1586481 RepID=A0AAV8VU71_9CUCU|nr:hypothetical protein NQ315_002605 [Exocentrus adspersus]
MNATRYTSTVERGYLEKKGNLEQNFTFYLFYDMWQHPIINGCFDTISLKMPRRHKKKIPSKPYANYTEENLQKAISDIKSKTLTLRQASNKYKISLGTLSRKCNNKNMKKVGRPTVLSETEERHIAEGLLIAAEWGFPLSTRDLQEVIHSYLEKLGRQEIRFKENYPGKDWVSYFQERHPQLTNRLAENIKRNRANVSHEMISEYFNNLEQTLNNVPPNAIINYDETNLCDDPGRSKVLVRRGTKHPERCLDSSKSPLP